MPERSAGDGLGAFLGWVLDGSWFLGLVSAASCDLKALLGWVVADSLCLIYVCPFVAVLGALFE